MIYVFVFLGSLIFPSFLIYYDRKNKQKISLIFKILGSLTFVIIGLIGVKEPLPPADRLFLMALFLGLTGDIFLHVRHLYKESMPLFYIGGAAFFLGHVLYILGILTKLEGRFIRPLYTGLLISFILCMLLNRVMKAGKVFRFLCACYIVFVTCFMTFSGGLFFSGFLKGRLILFIGSVFFWASDMLLFYGMFVRKAWIDTALLYLYYTGQCLIALSLSL